MKVDIQNKKLEFCCKVCIAKMKEDYPNMSGCPFRNFDNEYCETLVEEHKKQKNYEAVLQKKRDYLRLYDVTIREDIKQNIEKSINLMTDVFLREIMFRRIIMHQSLAKIAEECHYSKRQIERYHIKALEQLEITE